MDKKNLEKKTEVNRNIDGETAEGHIARLALDNEVRAPQKKAPTKRAYVADGEETEGHLLVRQKR